MLVHHYGSYVWMDTFEMVEPASSFLVVVAVAVVVACALVVVPVDMVPSEPVVHQIVDAEWRRFADLVVNLVEAGREGGFAVEQSLEMHCPEPELVVDLVVGLDPGPDPDMRSLGMLVAGS